MTHKKVNFKEFNPVSKREWIDKAIVDLKGADFDKKLVWKNLSKIEVQPFYHVDDELALLPNTGENKQSVTNYRMIDVTSGRQGNNFAKKAIEEGVDGLLFVMKHPVPAAELLSDIELDKITVSFDLQTKPLDFVTDFISHIEKSEIAPSSLKGYFNLGIIYNYVTTGKLVASEFDALVEIVQLTNNYPQYKAVSLSGLVFLDSGANQAQEIAYTLNALVFVLDELTNRGVTAQSIFDKLHIELGIGSEYFPEIGKFRAFIHLIHTIANTYSVENISFDLVAKTAKWNKSVVDAHTNMLRSTTEAMSAILGNADGVLIDPFDSEFNTVSEFSNRIAGNITTILKEESYFGKVSNPVNGSYYIEEITTKLSVKALGLFKSIESLGGFCKAFEQEVLQQQIAEVCNTKMRLISQRRLVMVGVNKYPNLMETIDINRLSEQRVYDTAGKAVLKPKRAAFEIEILRRKTEDLVKKIGRRPVVALTGFGHLAMRKARAGFAYDFMGVSGFDILQEKSYDSVLIAAETTAKSDSDVVVICSSDDDYKKEALNFIQKFRSLNTEKVLLLAGNLKELEQELTDAGLDGFVHVKSDLIQTISAIQIKLNNTLRPLQS